MKKFAVLSIVLSMLITFTGCVRVETSYKINKDNTGYNSIMVAYNEPIMKELGFNPNLLMEEVYSVTKGLDMIKGSEYYSSKVGYLVDGMEFKGENRLLYFEDIRKIFREGKSVGNTVGYMEIDRGISRIELAFGEIRKAAEENNIFDTLFQEAGGEILFSIEIDFPVITHNATRVEGKKYIWDLMDIAKNPEKYGQVAFVEYNNGRGLSSVSRGILSRNSVRARIERYSRDDIEDMFELNVRSIDFHGLALEKLGLLTGTNEGLELGRKVNRIEGAVLYSRLIGVEHEIEKFKVLNPSYDTGFTDVPDWAKDTINYLHYMNLISGVSNDKFGSSLEMTENQFVTLILRALGYSETNGDFDWETADVTAYELGFYDDDYIPYNIIKTGGFTRGMMSYIAYNSLFVENKITGVRLLDNLIE